MSEAIKTPPASGAKLFVNGPDVIRHRVRCQICDRQIDDRSVALASHARTHVREGSALEHGRPGSRSWTLK
jgi:hypothetical protein